MNDIGYPSGRGGSIGDALIGGFHHRFKAGSLVKCPKMLKEIVGALQRDLVLARAKH